MEAVKNRHPMRILVSCSSGFTSSYFAHSIEDASKEAGIEVTVHGASYTEIDKIQELYDYILTAPQIVYKLQEYREKYGDKMIAVDSRTFATYDANRILNQIVHRDGTRVA